MAYVRIHSCFMQMESKKKNKRQKSVKTSNYQIMQNIQIMTYNIFKDSATVHVTCVMCYTGIELHCAQGVLRYLLVRMSSAHGSQSLVHMRCR